MYQRWPLCLRRLPRLIKRITNQFTIFKRDPERTEPRGGVVIGAAVQFSADCIR